MTYSQLLATLTILMAIGGFLLRANNQYLETKKDVEALRNDRIRLEKDFMGFQIDLKEFIKDNKQDHLTLMMAIKNQK